MQLSKFNNYINTIGRFFRRSYSQEGEDIVLKSLFSDKKKGFYVDIGAHHPFRFSNTYLFYKQGWRGVNIDATPGSMELFRKYRPRDINIEMPISNNNKKVNYYMFDEPALNSFSTSLSKDRDVYTKYNIKRIIKLKPKKLSVVLNKYIPKKTKIDFMSVDVEGFEYEVLVSNNWKKYSPKYLLVELLNYVQHTVDKDRVCSYLYSQKYEIVSKIGRTTLFKKRR